MTDESPQLPNEPNDELNEEPNETQKSMHFRGRVLRFIGMFIIAGVIMYAPMIASNTSGGEITFLLLIGLAGAGIHYAGRKLSPGALWSSVRGGCLAAIGPPIVGFVFLVLILGALSDSGLGELVGEILSIIGSIFGYR